MEIIDSAANNSLKKIINNYRDTYDFLSKYSIPKNVDLNSTNPKPITNTRIPDIKLNIHDLIEQIFFFHLNLSKYNL